MRSDLLLIKAAKKGKKHPKRTPSAAYFARVEAPMNGISVKMNKNLRICELKWESRFTDRFLGDPEKEIFSRQVRNVLYSNVLPTGVSAPQLIGWSDDLAATLGVLRPQEDVASIEILSGNRVHPEMKPYSSRYGGHQFGQWAGQLGDGRAITLGEIISPHFKRWELQLKGAGATPYSRRADGRAVLRSSLREFLCSEAMHFLNVPTTRALSLVVTGDLVVRDLFYDGNPRPEPGAIVCRVSPSFLRFGHFEILANQGEEVLLKDLAQFLVEFLNENQLASFELSDPDVYGKLLDEICRSTAVLVAHWMRVGFVHGVMNTDNMSVLGLTIDYGPYGWLEPYDPDWTPNTTDSQARRYRFGNQPGVAQWNLMRLCEAFFPLIRDEQRLYQSLKIYEDTFQQTHMEMMSQKLGLCSLEQKYLDELFQLLRMAETDYTLFFRALSDWKMDSTHFEKWIEWISPAFYKPESVGHDLRMRWAAWAKEYSQMLRFQGVPDLDRSLRIKAVNPKYVLRNYLAQNAIQQAENGDLSGIERLLRVLKTPYEDLPSESDLAEKRPDWARNAPGCSALSCSS